MGLFTRKPPPPPPPPKYQLSFGEVPSDLDQRERAFGASLAAFVSSPGAVFGYEESQAAVQASSHFFREGPVASAVLMRVANDLIAGMRNDRYEFDDVDRVMGVTGPQMAEAGLRRSEWGFTAGPVDAVKKAMGDIAQGRLHLIPLGDTNPSETHRLISTMLVAEARLKASGKL